MAGRNNRAGKGGGKEKGKEAVSSSVPMTPRGVLGLATGDPEERALAMEYDAIQKEAWSLMNTGDPKQGQLLKRMDKIEEIREAKGFASEGQRDKLRYEAANALKRKTEYQKERAAEQTGDKIVTEKQTKAQLAKALSERGFGYERLLAKEKLPTLKQQADAYNKYGKPKNQWATYTGQGTKELLTKVQDTARRRYGITFETFQQLKNTPKFAKLENEWKTYIESHGGNIPPSKVKEASQKIHTMYRELIGK